MQGTLGGWTREILPPAHLDVPEALRDRAEAEQKLREGARHQDERGGGDLKGRKAIFKRYMLG